MAAAGAGLRRTSNGGEQPGGARRRRWAAIASAVAALAVAFPVVLGAVACATPPPKVSAAAAAAVRADIEAGRSFYGAGDFGAAAQRFRAAADEAERCGVPGVERKARIGECTAWLRARRLPELASCTARLEALQHQQRASDPGVNTLLAVGAIAGNRPLPPFKIPGSVRPVVRRSAQESL